ncbi:MAG: cyclic nucleotide-binding domain-containing protein [Betaproteobacteria bacterium]|nr:cyclic nucleotide-binding domain-containing protein [Betaproteobacteria bacterium]
MSLLSRFRARKPSAPGREWTPRIVDALLRTPGWLALTPGEAAAVAEHMQVRSLQAGSVFIRQGDSAMGSGMMLLLDGEVAIEKKGAGPQDDGLVVSIAQPGALLGEMGILNDAPRSATCVASTDVVLALLSSDALRELVDRSPRAAAKLALGIASRLAEQLRSTSNKLSTLSQVTAAMHPTLDAASLTGAARRQRGSLR